jgi:general stress protein 26
MSYSNTDTGSKPADPYTQKNLNNEASLEEKIKDLVAFAEKQKFCMMATRIADSGLIVSRCMAVAGKASLTSTTKSLVNNKTNELQENNGIDFLFHANSESGKTDDLKSDSDINLAFLASSGEWASISGRADIVSDRDAVKKHYSPALKAWMGDLGDGVHDGGPNDPRIVLIKVKTVTAQYALSNRTAIGGLVEVAKGVVTGEAPSVNKLRQLSESEIQQWRSK